MSCFYLMRRTVKLSSTGEEVKTVQREVADILKGRTVVGHAIHNDLKVRRRQQRSNTLFEISTSIYVTLHVLFQILLLDHPKKKIRDTQKYKPFRKTAKVLHKHV